MLGTSGNVHLQTGCFSIVMFVCFQYRFVFRRSLKFLLPKRIAENKLKGGSLQEIGGEFLPMVFCGVFFFLRIYIYILSSELRQSAGFFGLRFPL